jgi:hypothetical protein
LIKKNKIFSGLKFKTHEKMEQGLVFYLPERNMDRGGYPATEERLIYDELGRKIIFLGRKVIEM